MLIQTAERVHAREMHERGEFWPRNALDLWWRAARRAPDRELLALRMLDHWRRHATINCGSRLHGPWLQWFLEDSEAFLYARTLDKMSVSAALAISSYRLLRGNYSGSAMSTVRSTDSHIYQAGLQGGTLDVPGLMAEAGSATLVVSNGYDQSGNGFDLSAGGSDRPRIVNAGTLDVTANGVPTIVFDGSNDTLYRASLLGMSGSPALSVCIVVKQSSAAGYFFALGTGTTGSCFRPTASAATTAYIDSNAANRTFTASSFATAHRCCVAGKAASATVSAWTYRQDGTALSQLGVTNGSQALTLSGAHCHWGACRNTIGAVTGWAPISSPLLMVFNAVLSGADLDLADQEMALHK